MADVGGADAAELRVRPGAPSARTSGARRACSKTQTGMRVRTMTGSPPHTPVIVSMLLTISGTLLP
jgi:hypothetical protein